MAHELDRGLFKGVTTFAGVGLWMSLMGSPADADDNSLSENVKQQ